jgi:hypothetical protein
MEIYALYKIWCSLLSFNSQLGLYLPLSPFFEFERSCSHRKTAKRRSRLVVAEFFISLLTMAWPSKSGTSGFTQIWKFWRHCCCRYGWYPLLVAIVVSAACALDLYSFVSCEFLQINIGFNPLNTGWNQSTANVGLFYYETGAVGGEFGDNLAPGCVRFSDAFEQQFIDGDRTWQASRVMGMISAISGMLSTVSAAE